MSCQATAELIDSNSAPSATETLALTDDQLMMVTGGGEESMPVREAGIRDSLIVPGMIGLMSALQQWHRDTSNSKDARGIPLGGGNSSEPNGA